MLDDVMSELDEDRQSYLMQMVRDGNQVFITATHLDSFAPADLAGHHIMRIKGGKLVD